MNVKRSLLGLTFCTCYLASHLTNKVSRRAGATARGLRACGPRPRSFPGLAGLDVNVKETDSERKHSEFHFPEFWLGLGVPSSTGGWGPGLAACTKPRALT